MISPPVDCRAFLGVAIAGEDRKNIGEDDASTLLSFVRDDCGVLDGVDVFELLRL